MHRVILPLFLLLVTYANAQTLMPARQVSYSPGPSSSFTGPTVQEALDSHQFTYQFTETDPVFNAWRHGYTGTLANILGSLPSGGTTISTNFIVKLNEDFGLIGQDLLNIDAYLIGPRPNDPMAHRHSGGTSIVYDVTYETQEIDGVVITNAVIVPVQTNVFLSLEQMYAQGNFTDGALVPTLQYNQNITKTNFTKVNDNTFLTTNLFAALAYMLDIDNTNTMFYDEQRSSNYWDWVDAFQQMDTNYAELPMNLGLSFPSIFTPYTESLLGEVDTRINLVGLGSNFLFRLNQDFGTVAQDFKNLDAYLVATPGVSDGWSVDYIVETQTNVVDGVRYVVDVVVPASSNQFFTLDQYYDDPEAATNLTLVGSLQLNQNITKTNFTKVNDNTFLTTNLFAAIGSMLDIDNTNTMFYDETRSSNYWAWVSAFQQMDTNYAELPLNLALNFPSIFTPYTESLLDEVDTRISLVGLGSNFLFKLNQDFGTVAQDFRNLDAYLVATPGVSDGWSVEYIVETQTNIVDGVSYIVDVAVPVSSNRFFTLDQYYDEPGVNTNLTLVGSLQLNQDIYSNNFELVNDNLDVNTNLFTFLRSLLTSSLNVPESAFEGTGGFDDWLDSYAYMDTDFVSLPTDLVLNFPNVFQEYTVEEFGTRGLLNVVTDDLTIHVSTNYSLAQVYALNDFDYLPHDVTLTYKWEDGVHEYNNPLSLDRLMVSGPGKVRFHGDIDTPDAINVVIRYNAAKNGSVMNYSRPELIEISGFDLDVHSDVRLNHSIHGFQAEHYANVRIRAPMRFRNFSFNGITAGNGSQILMSPSSPAATNPIRNFLFSPVGPPNNVNTTGIAGHAGSSVIYDKWLNEVGAKDDVVSFLGPTDAYRFFLDFSQGPSTFLFFEGGVRKDSTTAQADAVAWYGSRVALYNGSANLDGTNSLTGTIDTTLGGWVTSH